MTCEDCKWFLLIDDPGTAYRMSLISGKPSAPPASPAKTRYCIACPKPEDIESRYKIVCSIFSESDVAKENRLAAKDW